MTDFEKIHSFESLYNAYRKARQGKRWKGAAAKFEVNLLEALNLLSAQIRTKRYTMSPYNTFEVYEPKRRVVMSNSYKDKVVQHSLCDNVLEPILTRSFIRDNYASQVGKGTHYGLDRLQEFMRRFYRKNGIDGWILKGDISKYFYSIRHDVLKTLIREKITDPDVLWLIDLIIDIPKKGNDIHSDGFKIRRTAIECDVSIMTSLDTVKALVDVMEHRYTPDTVEVISLSDIK